MPPLVALAIPAIIGATAGGASGLVAGTGSTLAALTTAGNALATGIGVADAATKGKATEAALEKVTGRKRKAEALSERAQGEARRRSQEELQAKFNKKILTQQGTIRDQQRSAFRAGALGRGSGSSKSAVGIPGGKAPVSANTRLGGEGKRVIGL